MAPRKPRSQSDKIRDQQASTPQPERKDDGRPTNNLQAIREAEEKGLHRLLSDVRTLQGPLEEALALVKTRREAVNKRLDQGVADGYPKGMVRKMLAATAITGDRKDQRAEWEMEVRFRTYLGLPAMTQADLEDRMPNAAKDEQDWIGAGYGAGLRGDSCNPKAFDVPDRFHQVWMEAWGEGQTKLAMAMGKKPPKKPDLGVIQGGKDGPTDLGAETLKALGEAEPELVDQVVQDHADGDDVEGQRAADDAAFDQEPANSEPV